MTNATLRGKPDAGNPHVRFDEGEVASAKPRRGSLLYEIRLSILLSFLAGQALANPIAVNEGNPFSIYQAAMLEGLPLAVLLEWGATFWVGKRRWFWAVVLVNALTFPVFFSLVEILIKWAYGVPVAEVIIALVEGTVFCLLYGFRCWRRMYAASFVMNAFSYGVSLLFLA